jgi:hypothetical protein
MTEIPHGIGGGIEYIAVFISTEYRGAGALPLCASWFHPHLPYLTPARTAICIFLHIKLFAFILYAII